MFRSMTRRPTARRRGAVLIVVLAMLVLFAVLGLSFVLYSEAQLTAAQNKREQRNQEADPDATAAAQFYTGVILYGTTDEGSALRGHSFAELKYGYDYAGVTPQYLVPYAGSPVPNATPVNVTGQTNAAWNLAGVLERDVVNYTRINTGGTDWFIFDPMRATGATVRTSAAPTYARGYFNRAAPYTYPDRTNFHLAFQDPNTGEVVLPSFHRPDLFTNTNPAYAADPAAQIAQSLNPNNPRWQPSDTASRLRTLRPRPAEHPNFPPVPMNADGTYTGDVCNMKFTAGTQKNDSLWMYPGGPVMKWRGKNYVACVAPLILDLSSRVNISVAGNLKAGQSGTGNNGLPGGSQGLGVWEQGLWTAIGSDSDTQNIIIKRQGGMNDPPVDPYTGLAFTARINGLNLPPAYTLLDPDGNGASPAASDGPPLLPAAGGFTSFPQYLRPAPPATAQRFAYDPATGLAEVSKHPAQFNPLVYPRGQAGKPGGFGHDDLVRLAAWYSDPKGRNVATTSVPTGLQYLTNPTDGPIPQTVRASATTFSVTQQWASVKVSTNNTGGTATLGPVDLNRPLPDFRKNPALPLSPLNVWTPGAADGNYEKARSARQRLARDIFIRLAGTFGYIDGTSAVYVPATGNVTVLGDIATDPKVQAMAPLAQLAANVVDYIDSDDLVTAFVWNPTPAAVTNSPADPSLDPSNFDPAEIVKRVAFGTELPRLVLNEVYSGVFNERGEETTAPPGSKSAKPLKRRYWIELHNPTPAEAANSPARSDGGAARLRYQPAVTQLPDPITGTAGAYAGPDFNPYRIDIAEVPAPAMAGKPSVPYSQVITLAPPGTVALDPANAAVFTGMTVKLRVNNFIPTAATPPGPPPLAGTDGLNVVLPATAAAGANGSNQGYYLLGGQDQFPSKDVTNTLSLDDPPANPTYPVNAMAYDATPGAPAAADITTESDKTNVFILRRLVDPYRPAQEDPTKPNFNPFITVDYLENIPTRNQAKYSSAGAQPAPANLPTVGCIHPYASSPCYGSTPAASAAVKDQVSAAATPPSPVHTFFSVNNPVDNNRTVGTATVGFEWLPHMDRELISLPELMHVSQYSPAMLTAFFYNSLFYQGQTYTCSNVVFTNTLGLLETSSRLPGTPLGGRVPGRVNVNTVNSSGVLQAAFGRSEGTDYRLTNPTQVTDVWNSLSPATPPTAPATARTPNKVPRATVQEGGQDRPFIWGSANWPSDSPLVRSPFSPDSTDVKQLTFANPNALHPYFQLEPMRKAWNNITPVSDSFLLMMTVGFFEVENPGPWGVGNQPQLGKELSDKVPGDLRAQFAGVVDRSQLFTWITETDPASGALNVGVYTTQVPLASAPVNSDVPRAVQTKLVSDFIGNSIDIEAVPPLGTLPDGTVLPANKCAILGDGVVYPIQANTLLFVGYGEGTSNAGDGEWVSVRGVSQRQLMDASGALQKVPGQVTLNVGGGKATPHPAGSPVGNVVFGSPGPQPQVTFDQLRRRGLVPYFTRLEP